MVRNAHRWLTVLAGALLTLAVARPASAALPAYLELKIDGETVQGDVTRPNALGLIECQAYEQSVMARPDTETVYSVITCTKPVDQSTPTLLKALVQRTPVEASFRFYLIGPSGTEENFYTVSIRDARITGYRAVLPHTRDQAFQFFPPYEEISFTYDTITWSMAPDSANSFTVEGTGMSADADAGAAGAPPETAAAATPLLELKGEATDDVAYMEWSQATVPDGRKLAGYHIYRSAAPDALFIDENRITEVALQETAFKEEPGAGTFYYGVRAFWDDGSVGAESEPLEIVVK